MLHLIVAVVLVLPVQTCYHDCTFLKSMNTWSGPLKYEEDWGYASVREGARTFWWLYAVIPPTESRPLILWLQGGPGASSTGFGNFEETGPKTMNSSDNEATWLQLADIVYVDNPVGAGFSYVDNEDAFANNVSQIGKDLLEWLRIFLFTHPEYRTRPFFIFSESYGGKMAAEFAKVLMEEVSSSRVKMNLRGVVLGDSWISPVDYLNSWGEFLYANSYLDREQLARVNSQAKLCQKKVEEKQWAKATVCWSQLEDVVEKETGGVSWYNILKYGGQDDWAKKRRKRSSYVRGSTPCTECMKLLGSDKGRLFNRHVGALQRDELTTYMDTVARKKLGIIPEHVKFGAQSSAVFSKLSEDFMKPKWDTVDGLLMNGTNVIVYNGNQDLICDTIGTETWMNRLTWSGMETFRKLNKIKFDTKSSPFAGFKKKHQNLSFYLILRGGHMAPHDTPETALKVVEEILKDYSS